MAKADRFFKYLEGLQDPAAATPISTFIQELQLSHHAELIDSLPTKETIGGIKCHQYQGFWLQTPFLLGMLSCHQNFQARDTDIFLVSYPKTGTTWLQALAFAVKKRHQFPDIKQHPLLTANPHELVPYFELQYFVDNSPDLERDEHQRMLQTHLPFQLLPSSVLHQGSKIVYVCRNPKDTFISLWMFLSKFAPTENNKLEEEVIRFTNGVSTYGSYWDHVLGYWKESLEKTKSVLFLRYEEMKKDPNEVVRKLGEFLECPFSQEEQANGVVDEIVNICSFEHLSKLEVNRTGKQAIGVPNNTYFRRGEVGDSANFLSPESVKLIDQITEEKFIEYNLLV